MHHLRTGLRLRARADKDAATGCWSDGCGLCTGAHAWVLHRQAGAHRLHDGPKLYNAEGLPQQCSVTCIPRNPPRLRGAVHPAPQSVHLLVQGQLHTAAGFQKRTRTQAQGEAAASVPLWVAAVTQNSMEPQMRPRDSIPPTRHGHVRSMAAVHSMQERCAINDRRTPGGPVPSEVCRRLGT